MGRRLYARRYAQAAFEIALGANELDRWQSDLDKIAGLAGDVSLVAVLESPRLHFDAKAGLISGALGGLSPLALNLVYLLIARGRLGIAGDIADEYHRLLDSHRGIEHADVITAIPLDDGERQKLAEQLSAVTGKKVVVKAEVDPGVVGGVVARIGGKLLDGSTRSRLVSLKRELARGGR